MPTYCFRNGNKVIEEVHSMENIPEKIERNGKIYKRDFKAEFMAQYTQNPAAWPIKSRALAVHPSQRQEYIDFAKDHGVPTDFDKEGHPEFRTRKHRKEYCELVGAIDLDGGYGDPT